MNEFPVDRLSPRTGGISGPSGRVAIEVPFAAFQLDDLQIETSLRLDGVDLPSSDLRSLAGKVFMFPVNPVDGYIDGSIYIEHAHHPVDVTSLSFGDVSEAGLDTRIQARFVLTYEGLRQYTDFELELSVTLAHGAT